MGYTGINLEDVKLSNRSAILKLLNDRGAMPRKDIALELGLTPATVSLICTDLIAAGVLCETGEVEEEKRAGRRKVLVDINSDFRYVFSVCIEANATCIAISNLKGQKLAYRKLETDGKADPRQFLKAVADEGKALMWEQGIGKDAFLGAGVSVPGPVNRTEGTSLRAYRVWKEEVPVGQYLREELGCPVIVENNVKAFAEGELLYGSGKKQSDLLFLKWGPGIGSAIIIRNQVFHSHSTKMTEIGHCIVEKNGRLCRCGRHGCLETRASTHAIARQVREACTEETMPVLFHRVGGDVSRIEAHNFAEWIETEDEAMRQILDDCVEHLAREAVNAITLLAPDKVIIYGSMFEIPYLEERFKYFCSQYNGGFDPDFISRSVLGDKTDYIGPMAVAVNELFFMGVNPEEPEK